MTTSVVTSFVKEARDPNAIFRIPLNSPVQLAAERAGFFLALAVSLALSLFLCGPSYGGYTVSDKVKGNENIKFNWTQDDKPMAKLFKIDPFIINGSNVENYVFQPLADGVWDFRNLFPDKANQPAEFTFQAPAGATDWKQVIVAPNGTSSVYSGNIKKESPYSFFPLDDLPNIFHRIPDLAPASGGNPDLTIYTAVNLDLYLSSNPSWIANGSWSVGQTLDSLNVNIVNGVISGIEGIYWSTTPFQFDPDPNGVGFIPTGGDVNLLNSATFGEPIAVLEEHDGSSVPEPSTAIILGIGVISLLSCGIWKARRR